MEVPAGKQDEKREKRFVVAHVEKTFPHQAYTFLRKHRSFLGILISHRLSFLFWDNTAQP